MKKPTATLLVILAALLLTSIFLAYREHTYRQDKNSIETLILGDQRFREVQVTRKGFGIILRGNLKSKLDLESLYSEINNVKRGRIDSAIIVEK